LTVGLVSLSQRRERLPMIGVRASRSHLLLAGFMLLTPFVLAGCGSGSSKLATVEGKVTVDGAPANSGEVIFTATNGALSATIQPDGTYRALQVPVGSVQVSITPAPPTPPSASLGKDMPGAPAVARPVPIPKKYTTPGTSGLTTTVKGGTNQYNIELSSK
jgi:hypothetical protein